MAQVKDLTTEFAVVGRLASEILGGDMNRGVAPVTPEQLQLEDVPTVEPQRTEALLEKIRIVFDRLFTSLAHPAKRESYRIKEKALTILVNIIRDNPSPQSSGSSAILRARPVIQKRAFECLLVANELCPSVLPRSYSELLFASLRLLQTKTDARLGDCAQEYSALAGRVYQFITACLDSPLMVDLFDASLLRDISLCIVRDILPSADLPPKHSALTCLTALLQNRASNLKAETKDRLFSALIITLKITALFQRDRFLAEKDVIITRKLYATLSTFILSVAVHVGVLNVCTAVFRSGMEIRDTEVKALCRNGLQVIDTILRPRTPREVFEAPCNYVIEPATGQLTGSLQNTVKRTHAEMNAAPVDQSVPTASSHKDNFAASSSQKAETIVMDQGVGPEIPPSNKPSASNIEPADGESLNKRQRNEFAEVSPISKESSTTTAAESAQAESAPEVHISMSEPSVPEMNADAMELISFFKDIESDA